MKQRYLLDSHVFVWLDTMDVRLRSEHVQTLADPENDLYLSTASIWELSIKRSLRRLNFDKPFADAAKEKGIMLLPVLAEHAEAVERLPRHHNDPFDHMLIAQVMMEGLVLVTHDRVLGEYGVPILRV
jgi:PIN domain nuclease of toxin-antitoxin system